MSKPGDFTHIDAETVSYLSAPLAERVNYVMRDRWIGYGVAEKILMRMQDIMETPQRVRMPNLLIIGEGGNGKTHILREFFQQHPVSDRPEANTASVPVVFLNSPSEPNPGALAQRIIRAIGSPFHHSNSKSDKIFSAIEQLQLVKARLLLIDELHDVLSGNKSLAVVKMLKDISNETRIPIIAAGTPVAQSALAVDSQLEQRFSYVRIPFWGIATPETKLDYQRLLKSLELKIPLPEPSHLVADKKLIEIFDHAGGRIGDIVNVVTGAAVLALRAGEPSISQDRLREAGEAGPSTSRRRALEKN